MSAKKTNKAEGQNPNKIRKDGNNDKKSNIKFEFFNHYNNPEYIMHHDQRAAVSLKDKNENRIYRLENDLGHDIVTYRVDGGICKSNDIKKCDFAIYTVENHLILIELKGSDYLQAVR